MLGWRSLGRSRRLLQAWSRAGILDTLSDGERAGVSPWALVAVLLALGVVELLGVMGEAFAYFLRKFLIGALLRTNAFNHGLDRFDGLASRPSSGDAVNRLREDVDYIINAVAEWPLILAGLLEAAAAVVILATVDAQATFVVVVPVVLVFVVAALARQRIERYRRASRTSSGNVSDLIGTIFGAAETIKAAGAESRVMKRFDELNAARAKLTIRGRGVRAGGAVGVRAGRDRGAGRDSHAGSRSRSGPGTSRWATWRSLSCICG